MVDTVSIDANASVTDPVSIDTGTSPTGISPSLASSRAFKTAYGLGDVLGQGYDDLYQQFLNGNEASVRQQAAATIDQKSGESQMERIKNLGRLDQLSPDAINQVLASKTQTNPDLVLEQGYAHQYLSSLEQGAHETGDSWWNDATAQNPEHVKQQLLVGTELMTKSQKVLNELQDAEEQANSQGYFGWGVDQAKDILSLGMYKEFKMRAQTGDSWLSGLGLGTNMEDVTRNLLMLPTDQFNQKFSDIMTRLKQDNPALAVEFAKDVYGQSSSDRILGDFFTGFNVATLPGLPSVGKAVAGMIKSQTAEESARVVAPLAAGNVERAAVEKAIQLVGKDIDGKDPLSKAVSTLTANLRIDKQDILANSGNLSREALTRILDRYDQIQTDFISNLLTTARSERVPLSKVAEEKIEELRDKVVDLYPYYSDSILEVTGPHPMALDSTWEWQLHLGNSRGGIYTNEQNARIGARGRGIHDPDIQPHGLGYKIVLHHPFVETDDAVRRLFKEVPDAITPDSWLNATLGWIRTPDETLSIEDRINRKVATYAPNKWLQTARKSVTEIKDLTGFRNRNRFKDFERFVQSGQEKIDPDTKQLGYFYKSPGEMRDYYQQWYHRDPDEVEVEAYFAFKRIVEMDRMLREVAVHRNQSRVGAKMHSLFGFKDGKRISSPFFAAVLKSEFPIGDDSMLVMRPELGDHLLLKSNTLDSTLRAKLKKEWEQGKQKILEVYDPERRDLKDFIGSDSKIRYIIAQNVETKDLSWDQIPRRGGGHFEREYDNYIAQANMRHDDVTGYDHYEGDTHAAAVEIRGVGKKFAKALNDVRELIKAGRLPEARELSNKTLPWTWEEHLGMYQSQKGQPARFNVNEPFHVVPRGKTVMDLDNGLKERYPDTFRDGTRTGSLARVNQVQYTQERDAYDVMHVEDRGSKDNPVFHMQAAKLIDPIPMMNRGLNRIIHSLYMDDVKMSAIEHWAMDARPFLKADPSRVSYSPYRYFMEADGIGAFKFNAANAKQISQLLANRQKIKQFLSMPSSIDTLMHSASQSIVDSIYGKLGPKAINLAPSWLLPNLKDPTRFLRSYVYHMKVGLFSIPQFLVHATTYATVLGVAGPRMAVPGTLAAFLHGMAYINPRMVNSLDKIASKMGFGKAGDFMEAQRLLDSTGFIGVEGEQAILDSIYKNQIIKTKTSQFLDLGTMFFKSGLKSVRTAAWYTAYREFKDEFPEKVIGNAERNAILDRADLLAHNMSRASSSMLSKGVLSLPFQFYTYQLRLMELMTGSRLSLLEKTRLFSTNLALFGLPVAGSLYGWPLDDKIRRDAQNNGYVIGKNWLDTFVMEGGLSVLTHLVTGHYYNIGERYGTKGFEPLQEAMRSDESFWSIYGGATGSTLFNQLEETDGFWRAMGSAYKTAMGIKQDNELFPFRPEDFLGPLKEVSSVNAWNRYWQALNTGHWLSKNGTYLDDVTGRDALFMTVSGLVHQEQSDAFTKGETVRYEKQSEENTVRKFVQQMGAGYQSLLDNDPDTAAIYFTRANTILVQDGYPVTRIHDAYATAAKTHDSLVNRINWNYYLRDVPEFRKSVAQDAFENLQQMQEERNK